MTCEVEVIAHGVSPTGKEIMTMRLRYWRAIHGEFMTHRVFSRNASSSRALPVKTTLKQVWNAPAGPIHWGKNQAGMQANTQLEGFKRKVAGFLWRTAGKVACGFAWGMMKIGLHKQVANRILEPWQYINVLVTATEWDNFYELRNHPDAQPEIQELAEEMRKASEASSPVSYSLKDWYLPFDPGTEFTLAERIKTSVARCARVSYNNFNGKPSTLKDDIALYEKLVGSTPLHASPTEHQAQIATLNNHISGNFRGWIQFRKAMESGYSPVN